VELRRLRLQLARTQGEAETRRYRTAKPTANPKIDAARMISVKLIDMDSSSPVARNMRNSALSNHLGWLTKIWRVGAERRHDKGAGVHF
jgi:hypothetical protein